MKQFESSLPFVFVDEYMFLIQDNTLYKIDVEQGCVVELCISKRHR